MGKSWANMGPSLIEVYLLLQELLDIPGDPQWVETITKDIHRQFPFHEMFLSPEGPGWVGRVCRVEFFEQIITDWNIQNSCLKNFSIHQICFRKNKWYLTKIHKCFIYYLFLFFFLIYVQYCVDKKIKKNKKNV